MTAALTPANVLCLLGLAVGAVIDYRTGRLPNWLTFSMMAVGIAIGATAGDPLFGVLGVALGFAIHFPLFALNVVRAGDAKLVMGAGAFLGWAGVLELTGWYAAIYIPTGLAMLAVKGRLRNLVTVSAKLATNPSKPDEAELAQLTHLRTGPVIAAAGLAAVFTEWLNIA